MFFPDIYVLFLSFIFHHSYVNKKNPNELRMNFPFFPYHCERVNLITAVQYSTSDGCVFVTKARQTDYHSINKHKSIKTSD